VQTKYVSLQVNSVVLPYERYRGCSSDIWQLWLKLGMFICNMMHTQRVFLAVDSLCSTLC